MLTYTRNLLLTFVIVLLAIYDIQAQNTGSISGQITDQQGRAVYRATIEVFKDSTSLEDIAITDSTGKYQIDKLKPHNYFLRVKHVAYQMHVTPKFTLQAGINTKNIVLKDSSYALDEFEIVASKPIVTIEGEKIVADVSAIPGVEGSTSLEMLNKLPGVVVDDESISLNGNSDVTLMINGQRRTMTMNQAMAILRTIPSNTIESVEIITGNSVKYDASGGGGIINVITKKSIQDGYNVSLTNTLTIDDYTRSRHSIYANMKAGKFTFFTSLAFNNSYSYYTRNATSTYNYNTTSPTVVTEELKGVTHSLSPSLVGGANYDISKKHRLGFNVSSYFENSDGERNRATNFTSANYIQLNDRTTDLKDNLTSTDLKYTWEIDTLGSQLEAIAGFLTGYSRQEQAYNYRSTNAEGIILGDPTIVNANIPLEGEQVSGQIDYAKGFKKGKLELGFKYTDGEIRNFVTYDTIVNEIPVRSTDLSENLTYSERVLAGYFNGMYSLSKKLTLSAGARLEHTNALAKSLTINSTTEQNYANFFPSVSFSYNGKGLRSLLKYSVGIIRPDYKYLNEYTYYTDQFGYRVGNPSLRPSINRNLILQNTIFNTITITLGIANRTDIVFQTNEQDANDPLITVYKPNNAAHATAGYVSANVYYSQFGGFWEGQVYGLFNMFKYKVKPGFSVNLDDTDLSTYYYFSTDNRFRFSKKFSITANFNYKAALTYYQGEKGNSWSLDLGANYRMLDNRLIITAKVRDVFYTANSIGRAYNSSYLSEYETLLNTRQFVLNASYSFGRLKERVRRGSFNDSEKNRFKN